MAKAFEFDPVDPGGAISTANRQISTPIPHPDDRGVIDTLRRYEPRALSGQPPIVWDRAEGVHVFDRHGNQWLDFTSGIVVAHAGHGMPDAVRAIVETARKPLHHTYCFPNAERAALVEYLMTRCAPDYLDKVVLLTTGSEAAECALKIARCYGHASGGREKDYIISFAEAFHGRTMGSQMAGGIAALKEWVAHPDPRMVNVPTPDAFFGGDASFDRFEETLRVREIDPGQIAGVVLETYLGWTANLLSADYVKRLRAFCDQHGILLIFDEVQAGFGRCGSMWGFQRYDIPADIIICGKGISSGLPLAAVIGHSKWMDIFPVGTLTSTHSGNPVCCAAALANLKSLVEGRLVDNAARLEAIVKQRLDHLRARHPDRIEKTAATGLVAVIRICRKDNREPDAEAARAIVKLAIECGLLLLAPGGTGAASVKLCPPLCITEEQLVEGLDVLEDVLAAALLYSRKIRE